MLGFDSYREYLQSPHWLRTRERYWSSDETDKACVCGESEELDLHHLTYERVGAEDLSDLRPLCKRCHNLVHVLERRSELSIDLTGLLSEHRALAYRAQLEAIADRRAGEDADHAAENAAHLDGLGRHELLRELERRAARNHVDVRSELRQIDYILRKVRTKVTGSTPPIPRVDRPAA